MSLISIVIDRPAYEEKQIFEGVADTFGAVNEIPQLAVLQLAPENNVTVLVFLTDVAAILAVVKFLKTVTQVASHDLLLRDYLRRGSYLLWSLCGPLFFDLIQLFIFDLGLAFIVSCDLLGGLDLHLSNRLHLFSGLYLRLFNRHRFFGSISNTACKSKFVFGALCSQLPHNFTLYFPSFLLQQAVLRHWSAVKTDGRLVLRAEPVAFLLVLEASLSTLLALIVPCVLFFANSPRHQTLEWT